MNKTLAQIPPPPTDPAFLSVEFPASPLTSTHTAEPARVLHDYELVTFAGRVICHKRQTPYEAVTDNLELRRLSAPGRWVRED